METVESKIEQDLKQRVGDFPRSHEEDVGVTTQQPNCGCLPDHKSPPNTILSEKAYGCVVVQAQKLSDPKPKTTLAQN